MVASREVIAITSDPARELAALEEIIETCLDAASRFERAWQRAAEALNTIRAKKLHKLKGFKKFEDYAKHQFGIGRTQAFQKVKLIGLVEKSGIPDFSDLAETHVAELSGFPRELWQEIKDTAEATAPGGKLTAAWIEQTGRRVMEAKQAEIKAAQQAPPMLDDDDDEGDCPDDPKPPPRPAVQPPTRSEQAIQDAARHPVAMQDQIKKWERQAEKTVHKLQRLALHLNTTPEDLLAKYGPG